MKEGLIFEEGKLLYYKDGTPFHAGVIQEDGAIYYIGSGGQAVKGEHIVHREMTNGLLKRGTYTFGEDCKLVKGSYVAPKKRKKAKHPRKSSGKSKKGQKKRILYTAAALGCLVLLLLLASVLQGTDSMLPLPQFLEPKVVLPSFDEDVLLCTPAAKMEYDGMLPLEEAVPGGDPYQPFLFPYHFTEASGVLLLSEQENLENAREYPLPMDSQYVPIHNLKTDTTYYYQVTVDGQTYPGTFHTAPSTRYVSIPGVANARDIGGYVNRNGEMVRQGLLIRGSELDGLGNPQFFMEETAVDTVMDTFGFVYDMDLRSSSVYSGDYVSRLGPQVGHRFYRAPMYGEIFREDYYPSLKAIFTDLADPEKYPMYLHCTWGRDRAGTIVFLLQGVLNMSEEDMLREFRRSAYAYDTFSPNSDSMDVVIHFLENYPGATLQERIVFFLVMEIGITPQQIDSIRSIFLYG